MVRVAESSTCSDVITGSGPDVDQLLEVVRVLCTRSVYATIVNVSRCGVDRPAVLVAMIVTV
jgi:hypothetical protein